MRRTFTSLLLILFAGFIGGAGAQTVSCNITDAVPCKKIRIYNNNPPKGKPIYTFFESFIQEGGDKADLWMQAQFEITDWDENFMSPRKFVTTRLRRAYIVIGDDEGISPGGWVEITVPFYTQLIATTI